MASNNYILFIMEAFMVSSCNGLTMTSLIFETPIEFEFTEETYTDTFFYQQSFVTTTNPEKDLINEFSLCIDFNPDVLLRQNLVQIGKLFDVDLQDLKHGQIKVNLNGWGYWVELEEPFFPRHWHRMCLSYKEDKLQVCMIFLSDNKVFHLSNICLDCS